MTKDLGPSLGLPYNHCCSHSKFGLKIHDAKKLKYPTSTQNLHFVVYKILFVYLKLFCQKKDNISNFIHLFSCCKELTTWREGNARYWMTVTKSQPLVTLDMEIRFKVSDQIKPELMLWMTREEPRGKISWFLSC